MGSGRNGRLVMALGAALALGAGVAAWADDGTPRMAPQPGSESPADMNAQLKVVTDAMQKADAATLTQLYQTATDPVVHVWTAMALERVHFNLDAASADAKACEDALFDSRPGLALSCGQFRVGNLTLAGRAAEATQAERDLISRYRGHRVERRLDNMQAYLDGRADVAPLSYEIPSGDVTLKLDETSAIPRFKVSANGHELTAMLDTGASDFIVGREEAERLAVKPLDKTGHVNGWLAKNVPSQAGVLETLSFGGITLHNVPVTVVPDPIVLIGGNLVAPLGTLKISSSTLQILGKDATAPACDTPMLVSSTPWGEALRLYPRLLVNDAPQSVMLDTGAHNYLIGTRVALDEVTTLRRDKTAMHDIGGRHEFANADDAKVKLTIAGQPFDITFRVYTDADNAKHPITLGAGALRDMDFLLDFRHQHQCFLLHSNLR
ncbi:aspartyl protease family protein [Dyella sp. C11]|uniref:aspartyl protease family protein n=1 Tax=Dyella sp. C11 TaxID=2126991 RepID=UPI00130079D0|nr:aspartyl protease family protein [Dyella sp. C11]